MVQLLIWIIPPVFYFLTVLFFRKQVEEPHISRIWYWGTVVALVPILGAILVLFIIAWNIFGLVNSEIKFKEGTKFSKKWLD